MKGSKVIGLNRVNGPFTAGILGLPGEGEVGQGVPKLLRPLPCIWSFFAHSPPLSPTHSLPLPLPQRSPGPLPWSSQAGTPSLEHTASLGAPGFHGAEFGNCRSCWEHRASQGGSAVIAQHAFVLDTGRGPRFCEGLDSGHQPRLPQGRWQR